MKSSFGPFHIPLRVRHVAAPYRTASEYVDYAAQFGPTWSNGGKRLQVAPSRMDFACPAYPEFHVETWNWADPAEAEFPRWRVLQKFHTKDEAVGFCERWRKQEREDEVRDHIERGAHIK